MRTLLIAVLVLGLAPALSMADEQRKSMMERAQERLSDPD